VGANMVPQTYPEAPRSYVLSNNKGIFSEIKIEQLSNIGMIKDALWSDIDNDGWSDLILVGDWMPVTVFKNDSGVLERMDLQITNELDETINSNGWWRSISQGDFDNDGDIDFLLGNQGLNNFINPSQDYPAYIFNADYDKNGSVDPLIGVYQDIDDER
jgi:hypothetical protein